MAMEILFAEGFENDSTPASLAVRYPQAQLLTTSTTLSTASPVLPGMRGMTVNATTSGGSLMSSYAGQCTPAFAATVREFFLAYKCISLSYWVRGNVVGGGVSAPCIVTGATTPTINLGHLNGGGVNNNHLMTINQYLPLGAAIPTIQNETAWRHFEFVYSNIADYQSTGVSCVSSFYLDQELKAQASYDIPSANYENPRLALYWFQRTEGSQPSFYKEFDSVILAASTTDTSFRVGPLHISRIQPATDIVKGAFLNAQGSQTNLYASVNKQDAVVDTPFVDTNQSTETSFGLSHQVPVGATVKAITLDVKASAGSGDSGTLTINREPLIQPNASWSSSALAVKPRVYIDLSDTEPEPAELVLTGPNAMVYVSTNEHSVLVSGIGNTNNNLRRSTDGGNVWENIGFPGASYVFTLSSSRTGQYVLVYVENPTGTPDMLAYSNNYGDSFTQKESPTVSPGVQISDDGLVFMLSGTVPKVSLDLGDTWQNITSSEVQLASVRMNSETKKLYGYNFANYSVYESSDYGNSWSLLCATPVVTSVASLEVRKSTVLISTNVDIQVSPDLGATWYEKTDIYLASASLSYDGFTVAALTTTAPVSLQAVHLFQGRAPEWKTVALPSVPTNQQRRTSVSPDGGSIYAIGPTSSVGRIFKSVFPPAVNLNDLDTMEFGAEATVLSGDFIFSPTSTQGAGVSANFTVPPNITSISTVLVSSGGAYTAPQFNNRGIHKGGHLTWVNNIVVTPGETLVLTASNALGSGYSIKRGATILAQANEPRATTTWDASALYPSGTYGTYLGGLAGTDADNNKYGGAGGAAGYNGEGGWGGNASTANVANASPNAPVGGGGSGAGSNASTGGSPKLGGGVGLYGLGSSGLGTTSVGNPGSGGVGAKYGGGATFLSPLTVQPVNGAIRIIWGPGTSFPNNAA